jgi:hypothetical protein
MLNTALQQVCDSQMCANYFRKRFIHQILLHRALSAAQSLTKVGEAMGAAWVGVTGACGYEGCKQATQDELWVFMYAL